MSEIDYEPDNKAILDSCCKIITRAVGEFTYKKNKVGTRRRIEEIKDQKRLKDELD